MVNPIVMQTFATLQDFTAAVRTLNRFTEVEINSMSMDYHIYNARIITFGEQGHDLSTHAAKCEAIIKFWKKM